MIYKITRKLHSLINMVLLKFRYSHIKANFNVTAPSYISCNKNNLFIGLDFFSGPKLYVSLSQFVSLNVGDSVMFGPEVMVLGGNHDTSYTSGHMRYNPTEDKNAKDIIVNDGAWVGARSILLSGTDIGEGSIIGANSVVNKYIPPYVIAAGTPVKVIKPRFQTSDELKLILENTGSRFTVEELIKTHSEYGVFYED